MPTVRFGGRQGQAVDFEVDDELIAVRTRSGDPMRKGTIHAAESAVLDDLESIAAFPEAGVEVFRRRSGVKRAPETLRDGLRAMPDTRFAGRVLVDAQSREPVLYTENIFVKFQDDCEPTRCEEILRAEGLAIRDKVPYATNAYFTAAAEGTGQAVFDIAERLLRLAEVELCHPEIVRSLGRRQIFPDQWHLRTTTINGVRVAASANVEAAHALAQGAGITIAIIDTGIDIDHEEFSSSGKIVAPRDATSRDDNPRPDFMDEDHGTACAGVACADGRFGASGVAPRARLMPIRMISQLGSRSEADAFYWAAQNGADVISCSWGPADGAWYNPNDPLHTRLVPLPDSTRLAIEYATTQGRGGKGCVICFAAGNGNESVEVDGYASFDKVLAIAACNDRGVRSVYSDFGPSVWCSFPSNDMEFAREGRPRPLTPGIYTTDRSGAPGYAPGKYARDFGGTSSACPGAAGVAALVLSRNPNLRWDEVRDVLRRACDRIDPTGGQYDANGHSDKYGYGRLNAETAVKLAVNEQPTSAISVMRQFDEPIPDMQDAEVTLDVGESAAIAKISARVNIEHTYIGDLIVTLVAPAATGVAPIVLHSRTGGGADNIAKTFDALNTPALSQLVGKSPIGQWKLQVRDRARLDSGSIRGFGLEIELATANRSVKYAQAEAVNVAPATPYNEARRAPKQRPRR